MSKRNISEIIHCVNPRRQEGIIDPDPTLKVDEEGFPELPPDYQILSNIRDESAQAFSNLTKTQMKYMYYYYACGISMTKIAEKCGVNKSTVSRTIARAITRLGKHFKIVKFVAIGIPQK